MSGKTYYSKDYLPMKKRACNKESKQALKDHKIFCKNLRGIFGRKRRAEEYKKKRFEKYYNMAWDYSLDLYTYQYICYSLLESGKGQATITMEDHDNDGIIDEYNIGDTERGWNKIKDEAYTSYLKNYKDHTEQREYILNNIQKAIEKRTPLILSLLKEKPRSRGIPAKVRYKVYMRDNGKCVFCGSNINIEFDHIIPFSKGGSHNIDNIRILCQECNRKRGNDIEKF